MTINQLFFALVGTYTAIGGLFLGILLKYLDAKIGKVDQKIDLKIDHSDSKLELRFDSVDDKLDSLGKQIDLLVQYMISHEGRIATLEERTKNK